MVIMPQYKDEKSGTWYAKFYYTDYTGTKKQKKKRGFPTKREAAAWERSFLEKQQTDLTMSFKILVELYYEDISHHLRPRTIYLKKLIIDLKIIPCFGNFSVNEIEVSHIRKWQNSLISYRDKDGKPFADTYLRSINAQLSAIFNFAVRYYNLSDNPCKRAGIMGKSKGDAMNFWTKEEFERFLAHMSNHPHSRTAFLTLFYTGMRIGELLALEYADIDFQECKISINKSYQRFNRQDIITPPKTQKSIRTITIPTFLRDELLDYTNKIYKISKNNRIFPYAKSYFEYEIIRGTKDGTVKRIRLHDLRHSHASLLIELGFAPLLIAERLGHENIETTLNTYSHLYPQKQNEISDKLQSLVIVPN